MEPHRITPPPVPPIPQEAVEAPVTPRRHLSRDARIEIQALRNYAEWTYEQIALRTPYTLRQVQYACTHPATPQHQKKKYRKALRTPQKQQLREWLQSDPEHRKIPWADLPFILPPPLNQFRETALSSALRDLGYERTVCPRKIRLTEAHKRARIAFAQEHLRLRPTPEDWDSVIWTDETWATGNPTWKQWITIHNTEDPATWSLIRTKSFGWMFWGCFAGMKKGPSIFWEKDWGGITAHKYIFFILPLARAFFHDNADILHFMHDNAPPHRADITQDALELMGLSTFSWPANSPDLNPIENLWAYMKNWIEREYDIQSLTRIELREAIMKSWEAIPEELLLRLSRTMVWRLNRVLQLHGDSIGT